MKLIVFFVTYILLLLSSSIVITSFFCVTRGEIEIAPDGSERKYGKILKGYFFFWFKEKGKRHILYMDDQLAGLVHQAKEHYYEDIRLIGDPFTPGSITKFETSKTFTQVVPLLRQKLEVLFQIEESTDDKIIVTAYEEEHVYVFPLWLRTMMAGCITCTPTVYGNITYWTFIFAIKKTVLYSLTTKHVHNQSVTEFPVSKFLKNILLTKYSPEICAEMKVLILGKIEKACKSTIYRLLISFGIRPSGERGFNTLPRKSASIQYFEGLQFRYSPNYSPFLILLLPSANA